MPETTKRVFSLPLRKLKIDRNVLALLDPDVARAHKAIPIVQNDNTLLVAMENPTDTESLKALKAALAPLNIFPIQGAWREIEDTIEEYYAPDVCEARAQAITLQKIVRHESDRLKERFPDDDSITKRLALLFIYQGIGYKADCIEFSWIKGKQRGTTFFEIDGKRHDFSKTPSGVKDRLLACYRELAGLEPTTTKMNEEGTFTIPFGDNELTINLIWRQSPDFQMIELRPVLKTV